VEILVFTYYSGKEEQLNLLFCLSIYYEVSYDRYSHMLNNGFLLVTIIIEFSVSFMKLHCTSTVNTLIPLDKGLFGWLVADGWCWFVLREEYCWLVAAGCWWLIRSERKVLLAGG
jgi:hypothetical protein